MASWPVGGVEQARLRASYLAHLELHPDALWRDGPPAHLTASAFVFDQDQRNVLLTLHRKGGFWVQCGGHIKPDDITLSAAALREATEESGIADLRMAPGLAAIHVHALTCSLGVPTRHLDLQFVARAPEAAQIAVSDESDDLRWWPADALPPGSDHALVYLVAQARERVTRGA